MISKIPLDSDQWVSALVRRGAPPLFLSYIAKGQLLVLSN